MREYSNVISLTKNSRGIYTLDPIMGCNSGMVENKLGCYGDCYSAKSAKLYGYDFSKNVLRDFKDRKHLLQTVKEIRSIELPFVRMGSSGDPSEDWNHTIKICKLISPHLKEIQLNLFNKIESKQIVIITKHWKEITSENLDEISRLNICVNTSVSAIDSNLDYRINQYEKLKLYCKSVLRVVTFDFNLENKLGHNYHKIQAQLLKYDNVIDTVFRSSKHNRLVKDGIINIKKSKFLGKSVFISKNNPKTYFGKCSSCLEMCGTNLK